MLGAEPLLAALVQQARLLAAEYAQCEPVAPVPGLAWDAKTVFAHTGAVHRWAADIVTRRLATNETGDSNAFLPSVRDTARLATWFDEGVDLLSATLRTAPVSLQCFTFVPGVSPRTFWIRRQAHETAIHRADVQGAAGRSVTAVDVSFAQDGLGEIVGAFATESAFATDHRGRLLLEATDGPAWLVEFGGMRNVVTSGELAGTDVDAVVRGTSDELYRWAWNRPVGVETSGDTSVLKAWCAVRVT